MSDEKSAVERLASAWEHQDRYFPSGPQYAVDLRAAIEADRAAEIGAYGRAKQTISEMRTRFAKESQEHARKARALHTAEAEVARLWAKVARVEEALARHPSACDKYPDPDDTPSCEWKRAVADVTAALADEGGE